MSFSFSAGKNETNRADQSETPAKDQTVNNNNGESTAGEGIARVRSPFKTVAQGARLVGQLISENAGSEKFAALLENVKKILKETARADSEFLVIPLPKESTRLYFSAIALVRRPNVPVEPGWPITNAVHAQVLLMEATGDNPRPYTDESVRGRAVQVTPTAEDIYDNRFITAVQRIILDTIGVKDAEINLMDCVVIRRSLDVSEPNNVRRLVSASTTGINTRALQRHPAFSDWNLADWIGDSKDVQLPVTIEATTTEVLTTANGDFVHADMAVTVGIESRSRDRNPQWNDEMGSTPVCETMVNLELVPVPPDMLNESDYGGGRRRRRDRDFEPLAAWMPRANVVHIEQFQARTTAGILFAAGSLSELNRNRQWASLFRPRRGASARNDVNFYDIGALNIHANVQDEPGEYGEPIDTAHAEFGDTEFGILLDRTVTQNMAIGIDCPDTGLQAYYTAPFAAIATGDSATVRRATKDIFQSAMDLTNGAIASYFDPDRQSIVEGNGERFHMGYWRDANGQNRDIRQLASFLPIANMVSGNGSNMRLLDEWIDTWFGNQDENYRLAERLKILSAISDESLVVTGMGVRVMLSADFADSLASAIRDTRAPLVPRNGDTTAVIQQRRLTSNYGAGALLRSSGVTRSIERRTSDRSYRRSY